MERVEIPESSRGETEDQLWAWAWAVRKRVGWGSARLLAQVEGGS